MELTHRYWEVASLAMGLGVTGVLLARPLLVAGAVTVGAWLLATQFAFVWALDRTTDSLTVEQSISNSHPITDEETSVTLAVTLGEASPLAVTVEAAPPIAAADTGGTLHVELPPGSTAGTMVGTHSYPVAGTFRFDEPSVTATDPDGLYRQTGRQGSAPTVTVEPRLPDDIHIGQGGERIATAYGQHPAGRLGAGLDPAELREYVPGDTARRIDWNATARFNTPYVREYEAETDRETALVVDHRAAIGEGLAGTSPFAYLREVAIGYLEYARDLDDPIGLYTIGDGGITTEIRPTSDRGTYRRIRQTLFDLSPTPDEPQSSSLSHLGADAAQRRASCLRTDRSAFGRTLGPYLTDQHSYVQRTAADPLVEVIQTRINDLQGTTWTVLFTDDADRHRLRQAVKLAQRGDGRVIVFIAPRVLFEAGGLSDLETAYKEYLAFEEFRRELARLDRVFAFEVAPDDRLGAVLSSRRQQRGGVSV
jgi:uncharacterized protein (DUF58 family)